MADRQNHSQCERAERVGLDSGGEGCSIFYLEVMGEAVLIRTTDAEETKF